MATYVYGPRNTYWPPWVDTGRPENTRKFSSRELSEIRHYLSARLNITLPGRTSQITRELKEAISKAYSKVIEDNYDLGVFFYHDYLSCCMTTSSCFSRALYQSNRHIMKLLAKHYAEELRHDRYNIYHSGQWKYNNMTDEEIIQELEFIISEIAPLIGTPYDSYINRRFKDPDPEDKDYDSDYEYVPKEYDPERVRGITVAEARILLFRTIQQKRFNVTKWLMEKLDAPADVGCFMRPRRMLTDEVFYPFNSDDDESDIVDMLDFSVDHEYEPRPLFREILSRSTQRTMKIMHKALTLKYCPEEIRTKVLSIFHGDDEFTEKIEQVFSSCHQGRELLRLARERE